MTKKKAANLVPAYQSKIQVIEPFYPDGGFHADAQVFKPFTVFTDATETLDAIAAGTEAGIIDRNRWVSQVFASEDVFREFMYELSIYDQCFRLRDRWYEALRRIAARDDEEGFVTCEEIVEVLSAAAVNTGQIAVG